MMMPKTPGLEPPGPGGGAAERMKQFEEARGLEPDVGTPPEEAVEETPDEATDEPGGEATEGGPDEVSTGDNGNGDANGGRNA